MNKELLQQALDALNSGNFLERTAAVRVLEAAIAQPEQPAAPARTFDLQDELDRLQSSWDLQEGEMRDVKSVVIAALAQHAQPEQPTPAKYAQGYCEGFNDACKPAQRVQTDLGEVYISGCEYGRELANLKASLSTIAQPEQPCMPMTDAEIIKIARRTETAEPGRDGYILPISFARAVIEAIAQPVQLDFEIVGYQFQWTNPADNTDHDGTLTKWEEVVPSWNQTVQQKIDELLAYRYSGKPIYRVRVLYTTTGIAQTAQTEQPAINNCPNFEDCKGLCFQCEYFNSETGLTEYPATQPPQRPHHE